MEQKKRIIRITRTAVFLALLIVLQAATAPLGSTLLTGSVVNFLLITSLMLLLRALQLQYFPRCWQGFWG